MLEFTINYNMRCIETCIAGMERSICPVINYNMRCIETDISVLVLSCFLDKLQHEMY